MERVGSVGIMGVGMMECWGVERGNVEPDEVNVDSRASSVDTELEDEGRCRPRG